MGPRGTKIDFPRGTLVYIVNYTLLCLHTYKVSCSFDEIHNLAKPHGRVRFIKKNISISHKLHGK